MEVEGLGRKAPVPKRLPVESGVVAACVDWSKQCAEYRRYSKGNQWQKGLKPAMTLFGGHFAESHFAGLATGKVAEWYAAKLFGVKLDLRFLPMGDGGVDLHLPCGPSQVKNGSASRMLVKCGSRELRFAEWFIATNWNGSEPFVSVLGYAHRQQVLDSEVQPGKGNWNNYVVSVQSLNPIGSLLAIRPIAEVL